MLWREGHELLGVHLRAVAYHRDFFGGVGSEIRPKPFGEHVMNDELHDFVERIDDRESCGGTGLGERFLEGEAGLDIELWVLADDLEAHDADQMAAGNDSAGSGLKGMDDDVVAGLYGQRRGDDRMVCVVEGLVFVSVGKPVEMPERMVPVPILVGLDFEYQTAGITGIWSSMVAPLREVQRCFPFPFLLLAQNLLRLGKMGKVARASGAGSTP
jgi:hypothetical protein